MTTTWLAELAAGGRSVSTCRRKLAAVLSFYRYAAAEGVTVTAPKPHQVPKLSRDDADTGALDTHQACQVCGRQPPAGSVPAPWSPSCCLRPADQRSPHPASPGS